MGFSLLKQLNEQDELAPAPSPAPSPSDGDSSGVSWTPLRNAPAFVSQYIHGLFDTNSLHDLTRSRPMDIEYVASIEGKGPDMRTDINQVAAHLKQNTKPAHITRIDDDDVFGIDRGSSVLFYDTSGYTHMVVKKGPTEIILRWPVGDTKPRLFAVGGTVTNPAAKRQITHHVTESNAYDVVDTKTGKVVHSFSHKSNPKTARKRARNKADKLDLEYGAIRYRVQPRSQNQ